MIPNLPVTMAETKRIVGNAGGVATIPPNDKRHAIIVMGVSGRQTNVGIGSVSQGNTGFGLAAGQLFVILSADQLGTGVQAAITLTDSAAAPQTYVYTEFLYAG